MLDGVDGASYMRSDATDYQNNTIYMRGDTVNETAYRNRGSFGSYDSSKTNHIWSMGTAYRNSSTGANFGNLYGLAYKHTNNATGGTMAGGHQMVWCQNGTPYAAMGTNIWTAGSVSGTEVIETSALKYKDITERVDPQVSLEKVVEIGKKGTAIGTLKSDETKKVHRWFIADEVAEVMPEVVKYADGEVDGLAYSRMLPDAYAAIAKQQEMIEKQSSMIEALMARVTELEGNT